jgi:hypothetical protein
MSREKALELYAWNLDISSALIVPLQVCEVAVRNGIAGSDRGGPWCELAVEQRLHSQPAAPEEQISLQSGR